jgi:hypothetical protein
VLDGPLAPTGTRPSRIYPLSTMRSDGGAIATAAFLGDGATEDAPYGLLVVDLATGEVTVPIHGPTWCNLHPQYCRAQDDRRHDILIQDNHGNSHRPDGSISKLGSGVGADIHLIRDDGTNPRSLPWGRDGIQHCQGHQCWRGRTDWAITSTSAFDGSPVETLLESQAVPGMTHDGSAIPGGKRNDLTRTHPEPHFGHFATDIAGQIIVSDYYPTGGDAIVLARLGRPGLDPATDWRTLAIPKAVRHKDSHSHPFLSPNGHTAFFNSNESGTLHAYMVRGF